MEDLALERKEVLINKVVEILLESLELGGQSY
jgi:hypothetical protein